MKRVVTSFILLAVLILCSGTACVLVSRCCSELYGSLREIQDIYESGDTEKALYLSNTLNSRWHECERLLSITVHDDKLSSLNMSIARITPLISNENDELIAEIQSIYHQLERIRETEIPAWYNIL